MLRTFFLPSYRFSNAFLKNLTLFFLRLVYLFDFKQNIFEGSQFCIFVFNPRTYFFCFLARRRRPPELKNSLLVFFFYFFLFLPLSSASSFLSLEPIRCSYDLMGMPSTINQSVEGSFPPCMLRRPKSYTIATQIL